jgi:fibronectin type 3 domain-containing protein
VPSGTSLNELYNSGSALGSGIKFTVPTVADGHVYVGTANSLTVFGLTSNPNTAPPAPTNLNLTASAVQGLQVKLAWTDNSNNENAFKIMRSTDGGAHYTQLGIASVNTTSFTDTSVVSGTTYYYQVIATNPIGDSSPATAGPVTPVFTSPLLWYHFDDGAGTFAADSGSVGTNTGVLVGTTPPSWVTGKIGTNALQFTGTGAYNQTKQSAVQVTSNMIAPLGTTSTLTAWVKTTQTGNNTSSQAPAITGVDQAGTTSDIAWGTLDASGHMGITVGTSGGIYSSSAINDGQWHSVVMTRDATTGLVQIYVDGVFNGQATVDTGNKGAQFYLIGALTDRNSTGYVTGANYFNGQLDDIRVYNRVLGSAEISEIGSAPSAPLGLSASPVPDSSSILSLSWTNTSDVAQNVQVERKTGVSGTYEQIASLSGTASTYFDPNLEAGTQYYYRVQASDSAGVSDYSNEANSSPPKPEVVGRFTFYNDSDWNNHNETSYTFDALAMDTNKHALLPGETATFANYTSYAKGVDGIAVDVEGFEGLVTPDDFTLKVGNSNDPSTWQSAPPPDEVRQYPGLGVNGSVRLELKWFDPVIQNEWLQVTLKADENTGLSDDDVFYFGNAVGDTGNSTADATVDATDELNIHNNYTSNASLTNIYDINRDKVVDAADESIVHNSYSGSSPLILFTAPGGIHGAGSGLENASVAPASGSSVDLGDQSVPLEPTLTQSVVTSISRLSAVSVAFPQAHDRSSSVDAVFDSFEGRPSKATSADSLLNLESSRHAVATTFADSDTTDYSHHWHASHNSDDARATDELIADEFALVQKDISLRPWLKRR